MLKMYGASDDLVEIEGKNPGCDEIGCYDQDVVVVIGDEATGGVYVAWHYSGVWSAEIAPIADGSAIPWAVRVRSGTRPNENEYTAVVEIDCPETVPVTTRKRSAKVRMRADAADEAQAVADRLRCELFEMTKDRDAKAAALAEIAKASGRTA